MICTPTMIVSCAKGPERSRFLGKSPKLPAAGNLSAAGVFMSQNFMMQNLSNSSSQMAISSVSEHHHHLVRQTEIVRLARNLLPLHPDRLF